jgi:hypothetical protein
MNCGITLVSESVLDYVNAVILAGFLAERFFVVSILFLQEGFSVNAAHRYIQYQMKAKIKPSRKTCPTPAPPDRLWRYPRRPFGRKSGFMHSCLVQIGGR